MVCVEVAEGRERDRFEVRSDGLKEVLAEHRLLHGSEFRGARWRFTGPPMPLAGALEPQTYAAFPIKFSKEYSRNFEKFIPLSALVKL